MHGLQRRAGIDTEPVAQPGAVALVAQQRGRGAAHGGLAVQQGRERGVVGHRVVDALEQRQRLGVLAERAQRPPEHQREAVAGAGRPGAQVCQRGRPVRGRWREGQAVTGGVAGVGCRAAPLGARCASYGIEEEQDVDPSAGSARR